MKDRLAQCIWRCEKSKHEFHALGMAGDWMPYGVFYMYARNGDVAHWIVVGGVGDYVFTQCQELTYELLLPLNLSEGQKYEIFSLINGICCDRAADGSLYQSSPYCPICDSPSRLVNQVQPLNAQDMDLPDITHNHWESLTLEQRRQLVLDELKRRGLI